MSMVWMIVALAAAEPVAGPSDADEDGADRVGVRVPVATPRLRLEGVSTAAWSPDGAILAVGGEDGAVRLYDGRTLARTLQLGEEVRSVAVGEGTVLALGREGRAAWDLATGKARAFPTIGLERVRHVAFGAEGLVAWGVASEGGGVARWTARGTTPIEDEHEWLPTRGASADGRRVAEGVGGAVVVAEGGRLLRAIPVLGAGPSLWMRPDGARVATSSNAGRLEVWDVDDAFELDDGAVARDVRFRPGARELAVLDEAGAVRVWDLAGARAEVVVPGGPGEEGAAMAWCPDGSCLVVAHGDTIELRRGAGWAEVAEVRLAAGERGPAEVTAVDVTPDGAVVAGTKDGRGVVWEAGSAPRELFAGLKAKHTGSAQRAPAKSIRRYAGVSRLRVSRDGATVAVKVDDGTVRVWDVAGGDARAAVHAPWGRPGDLAWGAGGDLLLHVAETGVVQRLTPGGSLEPLVGSLEERAVYGDAAAWAGRTRLARLASAQPCPDLPDLGDVAAWDLSADRRLVAAVHVGGGVGVWDSGTGALVRWLQAPMPPLDAAIDPTGTVLYTADRLGGTLVDIATGALVHRLEEARGDGVFSGWDGERLATLDARGTVRVWEVSAGASLGEFPVAGDVRRHALSPDGRFVAIGTTEALRVFEVDTSLLVWEVAAPSEDELAFSPDGRWLLARGGNERIGVFDVATGAPSFGREAGRAGDTSEARARDAAWGPDGWLACLDRDGALLVGVPGAEPRVSRAVRERGRKTVAWAGGTVVVQRSDAVEGWDGATGRRAWSRSLEARTPIDGGPGKLGADGALWRWQDGVVSRVDARTGHVLARHDGVGARGGLLAFAAGVVVTEGPGRTLQVWSARGELRRAVSVLPDGDWQSWTPAGVLTGLDRHGRAVVRGPSGTVAAGLPGGSLPAVPPLERVVDEPIGAWAAARGGVAGKGAGDGVGCATGCAATGFAATGFAATTGPLGVGLGVIWIGVRRRGRRDGGCPGGAGRRPGSGGRVVQRAGVSRGLAARSDGATTGSSSGIASP